MQQDPVPGKKIEPISVVNSYIYTWNNPNNFVDPNGKFPWLLLALAVAGAGTALNRAYDIKGSLTFGEFIGTALLGAVTGVAAPWVATAVGSAALTTGFSTAVAGLFATTAAVFTGAAAGYLNYVGGMKILGLKVNDSYAAGYAAAGALGSLLGAAGAGFVYNMGAGQLMSNIVGGIGLGQFGAMAFDPEGDREVYCNEVNNLCFTPGE